MYSLLSTTTKIALEQLPIPYRNLKHMSVSEEHQKRRATQYLCGRGRVRRRGRWSGRRAQERGGERRGGGGTPAAPPQQRLPSRRRCGQPPKQAHGIKLANPRRGRGEGTGAHEIKLGVRGPGGWSGVWVLGRVGAARAARSRVTV